MEEQMTKASTEQRDSRTELSAREAEAGDSFEWQCPECPHSFEYRLDDANAAELAVWSHMLRQHERIPAGTDLLGAAPRRELSP